MSRSQIRRTFLLLLIFGLAFEVFTIFFLELRSHMPQGISVKVFESIKEIQIQSINYVIYSFIGLPILYLCAYKKPGTRLLTIGICIGLILCIFRLFAPFYFLELYREIKVFEALHTLAGKWNALALKRQMFVQSLGCITGLFELFIMIKMRKENLAIQNESFFRNTHYLENVEQMQNALNLDDLNTFYSQSIKSFPQVEKFFTREYKALKRKF